MRDVPTLTRVDAIDARYEPQPWPFAVRERARIDSHWADLCAANPHLFDGEVLLAHRHAVETHADGTRVLTSGYLRTAYRDFLAWRDFGFPDTTMRNGFAMAALQGADGAFLLGEMAAHTANPGRIYFPAGTPDPSDIVGDRVDLAGSVMRELAEETGLSAADVVAAADWTIVAQGARLACMRIVRSALPADALAAVIDTFLARDPHAELAGMHVVRTRADLADPRIPPFATAYLDMMLPA